jgi:hypothetical protein
MVIASPSYAASIDSDACASSPAPASRTTWSASRLSRIGVLRAATSDTRLTASTSAVVLTSATEENSAGISERYLGNSPSSSRVVVRRVPPEKPAMPSPWAPLPSAIATSAPVVARVLAASLIVRAGMSAVAASTSPPGRHLSSRTASR